VVDVDASNIGAKAVSQQEQQGCLRVTAYASRMFNKAETNYCITRRLTLAAVFGIKHFLQYLPGCHFFLWTDHSTLSYIQTTAEPMGQQARWVDFSEQFHGDLVHRKGPSNSNADTLSRRPCGLECRQCVEHKTIVKIVTT
jgi:RNase H-like domain found in reverse transcriptase